jgi:hypothetical protein
MRKGDTQTEHERQHKSRHDVSKRRNGDGKERRKFLSRIIEGRQRTLAQHVREKPGAEKIGEQPRANGEQIGKADRNQQHLPRPLPEICDCRRYKADYDEGDKEP